MKSQKARSFGHYVDCWKGWHCLSLVRRASVDSVPRQSYQVLGIAGIYSQQPSWAQPRSRETVGLSPESLDQNGVSDVGNPRPWY